MKRGIRVTVCILLTALLAAACGKGEELKPNDPYIFYVNTDSTGLVKHGYQWKGDTTEEEIEDILKAMKQPEDTIDFHSAIPKNVKIEKYELQKTKLSLYFNGEYSKMEKSAEVLCRAAVVQSLVQISGVDYVCFYVDGRELAGEDGVSLGYMKAEDFVQSIGPALNSYQMATLDLFFSNQKGDRLVSETVSVRYNSNMSVEKLIVEQLMKGPAKEGAKGTISKEAKLLGVSVKDGICYVNFDEGFLAAGYDVEPKIAVYSIVNSIVEGGTASQVQISVNGETDVSFRDTVNLAKPFSRDLDLAEDKK